jgi:hypothetical protein
MGLQTAFDVLSQIVERLESSGNSVSDVEMTTSGGGAGTVRARIDVPISRCEASGSDRQPALTPEAATLTDDGRLQVEFSPPEILTLPSTTAATISSREQAVCVTDDDTLLVTLDLTIEATDGNGQLSEDDASQDAGNSAVGQESTTGASAAEVGQVDTSNRVAAEDDEQVRQLAAVRNEDVPPYEDRAYLEQLYESCATFTEMSQRIEMDVATETVRRYMIDAGIHTPDSYDMSSEDDVDERSPTTESGETGTADPTSNRAAPTTTGQEETRSDEQLVADGIGLPEGIQIEDVADAVVDSGTVFQVKRRLGLEHQPTRDLLEQLNLLDLVLCRVTDAGQQSSYEEVASRIYQCSPSQV